MPLQSTESRRDPVAETLRLLTESPAYAARTSTPSVEEVVEAWRMLQDVFQVRVGTRLSEGMSTAQLQEFSLLVDSGEDTAASDWLDRHAPQHQEILREVLDGLIAETADWFARGYRPVITDGGAR